MIDLLDVVKADGPHVLELLTHNFASDRFNCVPAERIWYGVAQGLYNVDKVIFAQEGVPGIARVLQLQPYWPGLILIGIKEVD